MSALGGGGEDDGMMQLNERGTFTLLLSRIAYYHQLMTTSHHMISCAQYISAGIILGLKDGTGIIK